MPNIQIVRENSLGLNRGIYADWMGNALSDANANALLAEGSAVLVAYNQPFVSGVLTGPQSANPDITGVVASTESGDLVGPDGVILYDNILGSSGYGQSFQTGASPTFDNRTFLFARTSESPFYGVNLRFFGNETTPFTLKFRVAASNEITADAPTEAYGDVYTVTVPARISAGVPSQVDVKNIPVLSVSRADGSVLPVIYILAETATGPVTLTSGNCNFLSSNKNVFASVNQGRWTKTVFKVGNFVDDPTGFTSTTATDLSLPFQVEFLTSTNKAITVMGIGDSIRHGAGPATGPKFLADGSPACYTISTPQRPIIFDNQGVPSTTTADFVVRFKNLLANGARPQILVYSPFSPNDGTPSQSIIDAQRARLKTVIALCGMYRIKLILTTPCPDSFASWNATADNFRKAFRDEIKTMGFPYVDYDAILSDQATPARFIPSLTTDLRHPNQAGYDLMKPALATVLTSVIYETA